MTPLENIHLFFLTLTAIFQDIEVIKSKKAKNVNNNIAVRDALLQLSRIYITHSRDRTVMAKILKRD
jgi:hypothetical protein